MAARLARTDVRLAVAWFAAALALYLATGARGLLWADASKLTLYAIAGYFPSLNPGDHAGWTVLAWAWLHLVGGDPVVAAHRFCALAGALTVALSFLVVLARGGDRGRAHTSAALVLVAHPIWWSATATETYAAALAATLAGALVVEAASGRARWWVAGFLWGLAVAIHAMAAFLIVPLAWDAARVHAWRLVPGILVGSTPVWLAVFGGPLDPLTGFAASGASTWSWHWGAFVAFGRAPFNALVLGGLLLYGLGPFGLAALWRRGEGRPGRRAWAACLAGLAVLLLGYAPYRLHLMVGFLLIGLVLARPVRLPAWARLAHVALQTLAYLAVPLALAVAGHASIGARVLPFRNNATYFLCPIKGLPFARSGGEDRSRWFDPGTDRYLASLASCAPASAVVLADFNPGAVLALAHAARGWRPDLTLRPVAVDVALSAADPVGALVAEVRREGASHPVVLADTFEPYYHTAELGSVFDLRPCRAGALVGPPRNGSSPARRRD